MNNIVIWEYDEAPDGYKTRAKLGQSGDWVAFVPIALYNKYKDKVNSFETLFADAIEEVKISPGVIYILSRAGR